MSLYNGVDMALGDLSARGSDYLQKIKFVADHFGAVGLTWDCVLKLLRELSVDPLRVVWGWGEGFRRATR